MKINTERVLGDLRALRKITDTPGQGVTRFSYGPQDARARQYIIEQALTAGCRVRVDRIGNIRIGLASNVPGRPTIYCGSHIDTVRNGGWLDGIYGTIGALEVARTLQENEQAAGADVRLLQTDATVGQSGVGQSSPAPAGADAAVPAELTASATGRPAPAADAREPGSAESDAAAAGQTAPDPGEDCWNYEVLIFAEEEGSNFGSTMTGSKFLTGIYGEADLDKLTDDAGRTLRQRLAEAGENGWLAPVPEAAESGDADPASAGIETGLPVPWDLSDAAAMLELHIEQGPVLERANLPIGIVDTIFGMRVIEVTLTGVGNHAGATPMKERRDALCTAAECILAAEEIVSADPEERTVVTAGKLEVYPNCSNVIPETVRFSLEVRDSDMDEIDGNMERILHEIRQIALDRNVLCQIREVAKSNSLALSEELIGLLEETAESSGIPCQIMNSGAVHDACMLAHAGVATGMIFVPSIDGRSHVPEEDTRESDLITGVQLLQDAVERLRG